MRARPASTRLERRVELGQRDFGQEAEAAEVDAENRDARAGLADAVGHRRAACRRRRARRPCRPSSASVDLVGDAAAVGRRHQRRGRRSRRSPRCPASRSHAAMSTRCGVAARRCDLATMPTREIGGGSSVIDGYPTTEDANSNRLNAEIASTLRRQLCDSAALRSLVTRSQVQEKLLVAGGAGDGRRAPSRSARSRRARPPR